MALAAGAGAGTAGGGTGAFDPNVRGWRNSFMQQTGQPPLLDRPDFNYREAYMLGNKHMPYENDPGFFHWDSRGKAPDHPTAWMQSYMDQFGGSDRKKFGMQKFKELLLHYHPLSMQDQKDLFAKAQEEWKGNAPQIDDMLVIGVKI